MCLVDAKLSFDIISVLNNRAALQLYTVYFFCTGATILSSSVAYVEYMKYNNKRGQSPLANFVARHHTTAQHQVHVESEIGQLITQIETTLFTNRAEVLGSPDFGC